MLDLRARFGGLVKAHRGRLGLTQEALAERAGISTDMVSKIEGGASGARFGVITQLAEALGVDPAELFTPDLPNGQLQRSTLTEITIRLANLGDSELKWLKDILDAALRPKS
jgi:transcriptional regulator with XRE-family HTH domain